MSSLKQNAKKRKKIKKTKGDKGDKGRVTQWCYCGNLSQEDMIACENPGCSIEWYHMECVNLDPENVPKGDWFCQKCTETAQKKSFGSTAEPHKPAPKPAPKAVPKLSPKKSSKPIFICEWCDSQFSSKLVCIEHKKQCGKKAKHLLPPKPSASSSIPYPSSPTTRPTTTHEVINLGSRSPSPQGLRSRSPISSTHHGERDDDGGAGATAAGSPLRSSHNPLSQFTSAQILACLEARNAAFTCECGTVFEDQTLYFLHRGCHNSSDAHRCSFCHYEAPNWYEFTRHFFQHKKSKAQA